MTAMTARARGLACAASGAGDNAVHKGALRRARKVIGVRSCERGTVSRDFVGDPAAASHASTEYRVASTENPRSFISELLEDIFDFA